ncbi:MAG: hypothetical protein HY077_14455 [Elusimicrobia bacterium]|nr:hypothetical protein [Elusimicrobiota bacterium]
MINRRTVFSAALLVLFLPAAIARARRPPVDPAPQTSGISVSLIEKRKLRLVRYPSGPNVPQGKVALDGALEVTIANQSQSRIRLVPKHEVHGLVFRPLGGGPPFVLIHDCQCVHDAQSTAWDAYGILRGQSRTLLFDDWGCSAAQWIPPKPGRYLVAYRTLVYPKKLPPSPAPSRESPAKLLAACKRELASDDYWKGAIISNAIEVTLGEPIPRPISTGL